MPSYSGKQKLEFCERLGEDWWKVADYFDIPPATQRTFQQGLEGRHLWEWLENRRRLGELPPGLIAINRQDLVELLKTKA